MVLNTLATKGLSLVDPVYFVMFTRLCFQIDLNNYFTHVSVLNMNINLFKGEFRSLTS